MSGDASMATERQRLADAFAMHLSAVDPRCTSALLGDVAYGLVPIRRRHADGEKRAVRIAHDFLDRIGARNCAAIGASASLFVHPNTFRHLPRRLAEIGEIDLNDSEARFPSCCNYGWCG